MWRCAKCETINSNEFCSVCGSPKPKEQQQQRVNQEQNTKQQNQNMNIPATNTVVEERIPATSGREAGVDFVKPEKKNKNGVLIAVLAILLVIAVTVATIAVVKLANNKPEVEKKTDYVSGEAVVDEADEKEETKTETTGKKKDDAADEEKKADADDEKKEEKVEKEDSDEDKAVAAAEKFFGAMVEFNFEEAVKYMDDKSFADDVPFKNAEDMVDQIFEMGGMEDYREDLEPVIEKMVDKVVSAGKYKVLSTEKDGDSYKVTAELTIASGDSLVDLEKLDIDLTDTDNISDAAKKALDAVEDISVDTETEKMEVYMIEKDGEWLVDTNKI